MLLRLYPRVWATKRRVIVTIAKILALTLMAIYPIGSARIAHPNPIRGSIKNGFHPFVRISVLLKRDAVAYAPIPKKAACPKDGYPANPPIKFHETDIAAYNTVKNIMFHIQC